MNLIIESSLCAPPSEVSCFRDVTLYGKIFIFEDILVQCEDGTRSIYWRWLKKHGAHDFISQLLKEDEREHGFKISPKKGNVNVDRIVCSNLNFIISSLPELRK
jgi:hypothetical protein